MTLSALAVLAPIAALAWACSASKTECDCAEPGARVHVPPESAGAVVEVRLSGSACAGQKATCTQGAAVGCATWSIQPVSSGVCTVDVVFVDTTFSADVTFQNGSDCCHGLYPVPASAGDVDAIHGQADGGGAG